jgi:hypothetical protein
VGCILWPVAIAVVALALVYIGYKAYNWVWATAKQKKWGKLVDASRATMQRARGSFVELGREFTQNGGMALLGGAVAHGVAEAMVNATTGAEIARLT